MSNPFYNSFTNSTDISEVDSITATDITCDNLVVNDTISLPDLVIPNDWIISVAGDKIIDPLRINNIYEKTASNGIILHNKLILRDANDQFDINIITPSFTSNKSVYLPPLTNTTDTIVLLQQAQTLTNKTLTSPIISTISNTGTITLPTSSDTLIGRATTDTLTNKTMDGNSNTFTNLPFSGVTGTSHLVTLTGTQTLTNKTLTSPIISTISNTGTLTLPTSTDTLVGRATTDTLSNKSISGSSNTFTNINASSIGTSGLVTNSNYDYIRYLDQYLATTSAPTFNSLSITYPNPLYCEQITRASGANGTSINITPNASFNYFFYTPSISSNGSDFLVAANNAQILTNKTLTSPIISTISNSGTITLPTGTRTLVARDTTDTLTNKTFASFLNTIGNTITVPGLASSDDMTLNNAFQTLSTKTMSSMAFLGTHTGTFNTSGLNYNSNTTDSTSTTSNSAIRTDGGISCAKNIYALNLYGRNLTTCYNVCIMTNGGTTHSFTTGTEALVKLSTVTYNPGGWTTNTTASNYYMQVPYTGYYNIAAMGWVTMTATTSNYQAQYIRKCTGTPNLGTDVMQTSVEFRFTSEMYLRVGGQVVYLTANDRLYTSIYANGTSPVISTTGDARRTCTLSAVFLGF